MLKPVAVALLFTFFMPGVVWADLRVTFVNASTAALENPHDIKLSPNGRRLFVSDVGNNRVELLNPDSLAHPNGRIYVAGAWSGNVVAYEKGEIVAELGSLSSPHDLELAPHGDLWLADAGNNRMLLLSPDLEIKRELKGPPYNFDGVRYVDVLPDGTLIAADKNTHSVKFIGPDGSQLLVLGSGQPEKGPNVFTTPEGVELRGDTLWISDSGNDRITKYRIARD